MQDIKDYLSYDPETGLFTRIKGVRVNRKLLGKPTGYKRPDGYIRIVVNGKRYFAHRLAWWYVHGVIPECNIDHKNGVKNDNRICNLRLDSNSENNQNINVLSAHNKSGYQGVSWWESKRKWRATITIKNKQMYLGYYDTPEEAHEAYLCAKRKYHPFWVENKVA